MAVTYIPRAFGGTLILTVTTTAPVALVVTATRRDDIVSVARRDNVVTATGRDNVASAKVRQ